MRGTGCPSCGREARIENLNTWSTDRVVSEGISLYGNKYTYTNTVSNGKCTSPIIVTCTSHGDSTTTPTEFISLKHGCYQCGVLSTEAKATSDAVRTFEHKANLVHQHKYTYRMQTYEKVRDPMVIVCPKHGEFKQKTFYTFKWKWVP